MRRGQSSAAACAALMLLAGSCTPPPPPGPVVSPTGIVYPPGTPPVETRLSQTARLYLRQDRVDRALELALDGIAEDATNPVHYFLAGASYARLRDYARADTMFTEAERIYPAYELEVEPEREAAWGDAFNLGLQTYDEGDVERTIEVWSQATQIYHLRPQAHRNLASLLSLEGRYDEAIETYRSGLSGLAERPATRVLTEAEIAERADAGAEMEASLAQLLMATDRFAEAEPLLRRQLEREPDNLQLRADLAAALTGQGRTGEARGLYAALLSERGLAATQLFNLGVGLFRASDFTEAADVFRRLTEMQPSSRDAWFNYANSLFAAEAWASLAAAGARLVELDPLGESSQLITARARLETGDRAGALATLEQVDAAPVYVGDLQMRSAGTGTSVVGRATGNAAEEGTAVTLVFFFYGDGGGLIGTETLGLRAPAPGEADTFEVTFARRASAYSYSLGS